MYNHCFTEILPIFSKKGFITQKWYMTKHKPRTHILIFTCNARDKVNTEHNTHRI